MANSVAHDNCTPISRGPTPFCGTGSGHAHIMGGQEFHLTSYVPIRVRVSVAEPSRTSKVCCKLHTLGSPDDAPSP